MRGLARVVGVALAVAGCGRAAADRTPDAPRATIPRARAGEPVTATPEGPDAPSALPAPAASLLLGGRTTTRPVSRREGHLDHPVCAGAASVAKERPHTAACCYPARELLMRPIRAAFPALRACYEARERRDAEGRVELTFRVERDGSIQRVCVPHAEMDDVPALRCIADAVRHVRYPAMGAADEDLCGLIHITYPIVFEP